MSAIWNPSSERIKASQLTHFTSWLQEESALYFDNYEALHRWSVAEPGQFWAALWRYLNIQYSHPYEQVLINPHQMPGAQWFPGAKLNFAENLLQRRDEHQALIMHTERGERACLTYQELYGAVARLAQQFKQWGLKPHDRVAALMPNCIETIVAMLATTSIGAIWSSCSPDFGVNGIFDRFGQIEPSILVTANGYQYNGKRLSLQETIETLLEKCPSIKNTLWIDFLGKDGAHFTRTDNYVSYEEALSHDVTDIRFEQLPFDHPLYIMYSSGTTGAPKCIVHGAGGTLLQHLKEHRLHVDLKSSDAFFYFTTCGWMMWNWWVSGLASGATLVLYDGAPFYPTPTRLWDIAEQESISIFGTSAKYLSSIQKESLIPERSHQLTELRTILSTGSPLLPEQYDYVYHSIKSDVQLSSISGGTDIISCFALGNPTLAVYPGELQSIGLGMDVHIYDEQGQAVIQEKGELVCTTPFPSMPLCFWNDPKGEKFYSAYFNRYPNTWAHGDYAEITHQGGLIIYGRSDAILNPGGVRIGTAEIYRQVEKMDDVKESLAVGQKHEGDERILLFVTLKENKPLSETLIQAIKKQIRDGASPRHVPSRIIQVKDIPKTISGKLVEIAVRDILLGHPVKNTDALANPESLDEYYSLVNSGALNG